MKATRRKDSTVTRKITSFRFNTELMKEFSTFAKDSGYNTTEALEMLMNQALHGFLPKKE